ncbi:prepilin-type N-terminal cleavage/methylation domain-containing protein [Halomonas elongata]|uniref:prepilin-type N-terminal cleavage/methylation domain-containing protein n=1 Tax=Halomonas elongata TaxID=2746 RepID=UPI004033AB9F
MSRARGFTLLEMLAALVLLAIAASVLFGAFGQSTRSLSRVAGHERLDAAARSLMDAFDDRRLTPGREQGRWDELAWTLEVTPQPSAPAGTVLYRLDLDVVDGRRRAHYATLRLRGREATP